MPSSTETLRCLHARRQVELIGAEISKLEDNLSFIQGDEIFDTGAASLVKEFGKLYATLSIIRVWLVNAVETNQQIDHEEAERKYREQQA